MLLAGCSREFLEAKPEDNLVVPTSLQDLQALLDNDRYMNGSVALSTGGPVPSLLLAGSDDYYVLDPQYAGFLLYSKNVYRWTKEDPYGGTQPLPDWSVPYRAVFYANTALEGLEKIQRTAANEGAWNNVRGSALFYRAYSFYGLAQAFAPPYSAATAGAPGVPLRMEADITEPIERATVQQTYERIVADLAEAVGLLPVTPPANTRPSKPAAYGLLARVYQAMGQYELSGRYADSALQLYPTLVDYNTVSETPTYPLNGNKEVVFYALANSLPISELWSGSTTRVDSNLYRSYAPNDLRRTLFFRVREPGHYSFRGSYAASGFLFAGLATDEWYFIRAEAHARAGRRAEALADLNTVLRTRWKTGTFTPLVAATDDEALALVLAERRKELVQRGLRWTDLRRLNGDPRFAKTLVRVVEGQTYTLPPGDPRYTWPIPEDVLGYHPGMPQNPR